MTALQLINLELLAQGYRTHYCTLDHTVLGPSGDHWEMISIELNQPGKHLSIRVARRNPTIVELSTDAHWNRRYDLNKPTSIESILTKVHTTVRTT